MLGTVARTTGKLALKGLTGLSIATAPLMAREIVDPFVRMGGFNRPGTEDAQRLQNAMGIQGGLGQMTQMKLGQQNELASIDLQRTSMGVANELAYILSGRDDAIARAVQGTRHSPMVTNMIRMGLL